MLTTLFYVFIGVLSIQIFYWIGIYLNFAIAKPHENNPKRIPVSIILYTKNQMHLLNNLLPKLLSQQYHEFEIVIVNNASTDDTADMCKEFATMYPNIRLVNVVNNEAFWGSKRYALTLGIKASRYEYLLFIDSDSQVNSDQWLWQMSSHFTLNKTTVIGHTEFTRKKGLFNKWIRFDHTFTQLQTFAFSKFIKPYHLYAKNVAYKKEEFFNVNGFIEYMNEYQYEQELMLKKIAHSKNTVICDQPQAKIIVEAFENKTDWRNHKRNQINLLKRLSFGAKFFHSLYNITKVFFYFVTIALLIALYNPIIVGSLFAAYFFISWLIMNAAYNKFEQKDLKWIFPIFEIFSIFSIIRFIPAYLSKSKKS